MKERDIDQLRAAIEGLMRQYPEMAEDDVLRADMLEGATDIDGVLTALIRLGEDARSMRDATKAQLENLKARGDRFGRRVEFSRAAMFKILEVGRLNKKELPEATVYLKKNQPNLVGEPDGDTLPDDLVKVERKPDRVAIKAALAGGRELPGLSLSNAPPSVVVMIR